MTLVMAVWTGRKAQQGEVGSPVAVFNRGLPLWSTVGVSDCRSVASSDPISASLLHPLGARATCLLPWPGAVSFDLRPSGAQHKGRRSRGRSGSDIDRCWQAVHSGAKPNTSPKDSCYHSHSKYVSLDHFALLPHFSPPSSLKICFPCFSLCTAYADCTSCQLSDLTIPWSTLCFLSYSRSRWHP